MAEQGKPIVIADPYNDPRFDPTHDRKTGFRTRSIATVPVASRDGDLAAVLQILNKQAGPFDHGDITAILASNIAFGIHHLSPSERHRRVAHLIEQVGLQGLARRRPTELSGGQGQRVALARAFAPSPRFLLLDEPFASLDRSGREQLRSSLRGILAESGIPTLLVTHDGHEALSLGDRFLMMQEGSLRPGPVAGQPVHTGG